MDGKNHRLAASLAVASKKIAPKAKKRVYFFSNPANARKARAAHTKRMASAKTTIHTDAIELAKAAWPNAHERVAHSSEAIRTAAKAALNI